MSSQRSKPKRPESFDDLPDYEKRHTLMSIWLTEPALLGGQVLSAAEVVIGAFRRAYPPEELVVRCDVTCLEVIRKLPGPELAPKLEAAQRAWDSMYGLVESAEAGA